MRAWMMARGRAQISWAEPTGQWARKQRQRGWPQQPLAPWIACEQGRDVRHGFSNYELQGTSDVMRWHDLVLQHNRTDNALELVVSLRLEKGRRDMASDNRVVVIGASESSSVRLVLWTIVHVIRILLSYVCSSCREAQSIRTRHIIPMDQPTIGTVEWRERL